MAAFPKLVDAANDVVVDDAIETVYTMFNGVQTLWQSNNEQEWYDKTTRCYLLLTAWYVADMYPRLAVGIQSTGGLPILSKKIGDVTIHYADTSKVNTMDSVLESLKSNRFGNKALMMIRSSPIRFRLQVTK